MAYWYGTPSTSAGQYRGWQIWNKEGVVFIQDSSWRTNDYFSSDSVAGIEHVIDVLLDGETLDGWHIVLTHPKGVAYWVATKGSMELHDEVLSTLEGWIRNLPANYNQDWRLPGSTQKSATTATDFRVVAIIVLLLVVGAALYFGSRKKRRGKG